MVKKNLRDNINKKQFLKWKQKKKEEVFNYEKEQKVFKKEKRRKYLNFWRLK